MNICENMLRSPKGFQNGIVHTLRICCILREDEQRNDFAFPKIQPNSLKSIIAAIVLVEIRQSNFLYKKLLVYLVGIGNI